MSDHLKALRNVSLLVTLTMCGSAAAVPYAFTQIDVPFPGISNTVISGINDHGEIVGWYSDGTQTHGFIRDGSTFVPIDVSLPSASNTRALGINDSGQVVGVYNIGSTQQLHGFLFDQGSFTFIDVPFANASQTQAAGINDQGQTVGDYFLQSGTHGFLRSGGAFTPIDVPNAATTSATGINNRGQLVGDFLDANFDSHAFLDSGTFSTIDVPVPNRTGTTAFGLNDAQQSWAVSSLATSYTTSMASFRIAPALRSSMCPLPARSIPQCETLAMKGCLSACSRTPAAATASWLLRSHPLTNLRRCCLLG